MVEYLLLLINSTDFANPLTVFFPQSPNRKNNGASDGLAQNLHVKDIHMSFKMNCNYFCDPLTFPLTASSGQSFSLSNTLVDDKISQLIIYLINRKFVAN